MNNINNVSCPDLQNLDIIELIATAKSFVFLNHLYVSLVGYYHDSYAITILSILKKSAVVKSITSAMKRYLYILLKIGTKTHEKLKGYSS